MSLQLQENQKLTTAPAAVSNAHTHKDGLRSFWEQRHLIEIMVRRDLIGKYRGSLLGALWPLVNPVGHLLLYTFVFSIVLKVKFGQDPSTSNFAIYLMTGLVPWGAFSDAIARSTTVILEVPNLVKKVVFPLEILPLVSTVSSAASQLAALVVLLAAAVLYFHQLHYTLIYLPLIVVSQILFTGGLSWFLASLGVYLRDIKHLMSLALSAWMYGTPIVYPASAFPKEISFLLYANPMAGIVEDYRRVILQGLAPDWTSYCSYTAISIVVWFAGLYFFNKTKRSFIDVM